MPWGTPKTDWETGELVAASDLNDIGNNLAYLKAPPTDLVSVNEASDYTTTSTSFVDVDSGGDPDLSLTIVTAGGDVMIGFSGSVSNSAASNVTLFDVTKDGTRIGGDDGLVAIAQYQSGTPSKVPVSFAILVQGLSAGTHTFKLQWRVSAGTSTLYAGAGTTNLDIHPQFWAREVS